MVLAVELMLGAIYLMAAAAAMSLVAAEASRQLQTPVSVVFPPFDASTAAGLLDNLSGAGSGDPDLLAKFFVKSFSEGERRLTMIGGSLPTDPICGGQPMVMAKDPLKGNGGCSASQTAQNLSCTCLLGYDSGTTWEFGFKPVSNGSGEAGDGLAAAPPAALTAKQGDVIGVNAMMLFQVPSTIAAMRVVGVEGAVPIPMSFKNTIPGGGVMALARSEETSGLLNLEVANIDLGSAVIQSGFVPTTLKNLTMRNCNLSSLSNDFLNSIFGLEILDLSSNSLSSVYGDVTPDKCKNSVCSLKELDLANNSFTEFPAFLLNLNKLQRLDLRGNKITNYTVSAQQFSVLSSLKEFSIDPPNDSYECSATGSGAWQTVQNAKFCVVESSPSSASTSAPAAVSTSNNSSSSSYLLYAVIFGSFAVAALIFLAVRKRHESGAMHRASLKDEEEGFESMFDGGTDSFDDSHTTLSSELLNDPIIIMHRIPYDEVRVATCLSKGGFGIVYSGMFQRRRVAIKKIRLDRGGDHNEVALIRQFVKEIALMATLNHPRIVEFIGVSWDALRNICAVTEFMNRGDLRAVLRGFKLRDCRLTWENHKTTISLHIAEALTYLHSLHPKVIHRDLKSKNVMINSDLEAKLSDFGISRERRFEETHMTAGIGTSFWIAPEVLLGKDYDERADIFSFGVVLCEIDTDDYPYWNEDHPAGSKEQEHAILKLVASGDVRPTFSDDVPKAILDLADSCLQVNPEDRPTAAEIAYTLQKMLRNSFRSSSSFDESVGAVEVDDDADRITHVAQKYVTIRETE